MGTKNNTESFVSSVLPSGTTTLSSSANYHQPGSSTAPVQLGVQQPQQPPQSQKNSASSSSGGGGSRVLANLPSTSSLNAAALQAAQISKHRLSMQLSRPPTTGSIGVSVITPAVGVASPQLTSVTVGSQKEAQAQQHKQQQHFKHQILTQQQQQQKLQNRNVAANESYGRSNVGSYATPTKLVSSATTGVTITPINSAYMPSKASKIVGPSPTASIVYSHTQHLPKYISSSRFLVHADKGDVLFNDDGTLGEIPDKRTQYSNHMPPDYQYVLQDHSYSQLPESPPPPPTPPTPTQRTTINGLSRINSATPTKITLNNNRLVTVSGGSAQLLNNFSSSSHHHGGSAHGHGRLNNQQQQHHHHQQQLHLQQQQQQHHQHQHHQQQQHHHHHHQPSSGLLTQANNNNSMNSYSSVSAIVNSVATSIHNNTSTSVIAVNPKKYFGPQSGHSSLAGVPKSLLKVGAIDRRDESDLSEDDRIPDPHGEETETAPEAEDDSVTRCVCDFQHDDGYMISCDKCLVWQHVACMGVSWSQIPEEYQCEKCQPRYIDKKRAVEIQKKWLSDKSRKDDSDSDPPTTNARSANKTQTKRKYKNRRPQNKRKNAKENIKEGKPTKRASGAGVGSGSGSSAASKKRQFSDGISSAVSSPVSPSPTSNSNMSAESKKQLLLERKQRLEKKQLLQFDKKQITKRSNRKPQTQNTKRSLDKSKTTDDEYERKSTGTYTDREEDSAHNIQQVREWVDRYEEAVTNHYSQELRARLSSIQVNGVHDLKYATLSKSAEKCKSMLLPTGGKIVVTTCSLSPSQPIIELRGKYMWTGAASFKQNDISPSTPYVFYYRLPKQDIEICVDCRKYGNFARFVRRSCKPNSELRHCIRKTSLHLYIIATQALKKNQEVLIGHFSPETANSCACNSPETCTAAKTPYPSHVSRYGDKHSRESPSIRSTSSSNKKTPINAEKGKKRPKEDKRKLTKEKRRGRRRSPSSGSNSDQEGSSSRDHSPTVPSKLTVNMWAKPTLNSSSSSTVVNDTAVTTPITNRNNNNNNNSSNTNNNNNEISAGEEVSDNESHSENEIAVSPGPNSNQVEESKPSISGAMVSASQSESATTNGLNAMSNSVDNHSDSEKPTVTTPTTPNNATSTKTPNSKATRNSDYAKKEKKQLDMPLFFQTPNNHKMTREEKKIQAIIRHFEQMEKTKARREENQQKHRRESTSDAEPCGVKKTPCKKGSTTTKSRRNTDTSESGRRPGDDENCAKNSRKSSQTTEDEDDDVKPSPDTSYNHHRAHAMKEEPKSDEGYRKQNYIVENGSAVRGFKTETEDDDSEDASGQDRGTDNEDDKPSNCTAVIETSKKMTSPMKIPIAGGMLAGFASPGTLSPVKVNNSRFDVKTPVTESSDKEPAKRKRNEGVAATPKSKSVKLQSPAKTRSMKPTPKGKATLKTKVLRGKKRKSESGAEDSPDTDPAVGEISQRTRSAVQRQKKATFTKPTKDDKKNSLANSPNKFKKTEDPVVSPFSTPPKSRERLDSSSSSGGTPPTPVSDTCLLVAAAVGHLTDFKFPNTKKELMNAWFKEERKPSPDEEAPNKLTNQEGSNEYAKKRWLRQAISEEGDSSGPRSEEVVSPNGDYGGPLKKRRFARESMSEQTCSSPTAGSFGSGGGGESNQMSFDDDDDDVASPDDACSLYRASEGDGVEAYHPTRLQNETKLSVTEETDSSKNNIRSGTPPAEDAPKTPTPPIDMDKDDSTIVVGSVLSSVLSAVANVDNQMPSIASPPRCVTPPVKIELKKPPEAASPPISKKKLSLTEYKQRKSTATPSLPTTPGLAIATTAAAASITAAECSDAIGDLVQEVPALASAPLPTIDPAETVERSSSRSSITSSSCSEEEDNSHAASAQVIARSLMMETRHLTYGPQASALFNSIRSGSLGAAGSQTFNAKPNASGGAALPRENLADRLKREFDVHVQEDEAEKNRTMPPPLSPIKMIVPGQPQIELCVGTTPKDLHLRLKKIQPPPPPPPPPVLPLPTLPPSMPLPDPSQLFAPFYPYPAVQRMPSYFTAPPPPPPPVPPPVPPPLLPPPPPPPPPK